MKEQLTCILGAGVRMWDDPNSGLGWAELWLRGVVTLKSCVASLRSKIKIQAICAAIFSNDDTSSSALVKPSAATRVIRKKTNSLIGTRIIGKVLVGIYSSHKFFIILSGRGPEKQHC